MEWSAAVRVDNLKGHNMKAIVIASLLALSFTTGFTCSKNAPEATAPATEVAPTEAAPAEGTPATEAAPAAPTEAAPAAPAETK